jgi:hypothetical protein
MLEEEHDGQEYGGHKKGTLRPRADEAAVQVIETKLLKYKKACQIIRMRRDFVVKNNPLWNAGCSTSLENRAMS